MAVERGKKHLNYLFLNVAPDKTTPVWARVHYSTDWEDSMNPNEVTYDFIADSAPTTEVENYAPKASISYSAYIGDPVYDYVFDIYANQKVGTDAATTAMRVWQKKDEDGKNIAQQTDVTITIQGFNDASQLLTFDITQRGTPIAGTATVNDGTPTFTPTKTTP